MKKLLFCICFIVLQAHAQTFVEAQSLVSPTQIEGDYFGFSISASDNFALVGARFKDLNPSLPHTQEGAIYAYQKGIDDQWRLTQEIFTPNGLTNSGFGKSIDIRGDYAIVGDHMGYSYIYRINSNGTLTEIKKIPRYGGDYMEYARFTSISDNWLVVGHGSEKDAGFNIEGSAHIYKKEASGNWVHAQKITASDRKGSHNFFGTEVSMSDNYLFARAKTGVYVFKRTVTDEWVEVQKIPITLGQGGRTLNDPIKVLGNIVVIANNGFYDSPNGGVAYVYELNTTTGLWVQKQELKAFGIGGQIDYGFGLSLDISNDYIVIGTSNIPNALEGGPYLFKKSTTGDWVPADNMTKPNFNGYLGNSVAISGDDIFLGVDRFDISTITDAGKVFIYRPSSLVCNSIIIPDTNFEQWLINENIDSDGIVNGVINRCDAEKVTELNIAPLQGISDLTGISAFINLEVLSIPENDLVTLDLSNNTKLISVNVFYNLLEQINITNCSELVSLNISDNFLRGLDLSGIRDLQSMDARTNADLTCIQVKDLAEANRKSSGRRPNWRIDRSASFSLSCPVVLRRISLSKIEKRRIREKKEIEKSIIVFPTQVTDGKLTILTEGYQYFDVSIYDLQGNMIKEFTNVLRRKDIDVSEFALGLYVAKIRQKEKVTIKRFIINR